ncbi:hypothetical protein ONZ45_g5024 [Pleurotus djamor]|nr:hypothetical protein ONZ45_g5024 [Pleurotus djamor]
MVWPFSSWKKEPVKITETGKDYVDLLILVLGLSGDGKSTFINTAAGDCIVKTSNELDPLKGTSEVEDFRKECEGLKVVFIDTPGLDSEDTTLSSVYAKATYDRTHADAIIYLHAATRKAVTEPPKTGDVMKKFQTLCGPSWKKRVIFAVSTRTNDGREEIVSGVKDSLKRRFYPEIEAMGFSPSSIADAWQIINKAVKSDPPT